MLGINTYGLSHLLNKDFDGTIVKLKKMGVTSLEPCVVMSDAFGMLRRIIYGIGFGFSGMDGGNWYGERAYYKAIDRTEKLGVDVLSVHCALCDVSPRILDRMIPHALDMFIMRRIANFVVSLNIKSKEEADSYIPILERFIELMTPAGGRVVYHNHDCEMKNGVLDYLMSSVPRLELELDAGWAAFAGVDPIEVAEKYEGRLRMLHLKDFANTTDRRSFVPIGDGILPLEDLVGFADSRNVLLVIDQDKSKDMMRDISRSIDNIRKYSYRV